MILLNRGNNYASNKVWTNVAALFDGGDGTYTTCGSTVANDQSALLVYYDWSAIPADSYIHSVNVFARYYVSNQSRFASVMINGISVPIHTSANVTSLQFAPTLPTAIEILFTRTSGTQSTTVYVDWIDVQVVYTPQYLSRGKVRVWNGTEWVLTNAVWNGSRWIPPDNAKAFNGQGWVVL